MTESRLWILGAPDPEMTAIEQLLRECGETVAYALDERGERVTPATAYRCPVPEAPEGATVYAVECIDVLPDGWVRIDHHRPGDPGYGCPPEEFMAASSIGQVIARLAIQRTWREETPGGDVYYPTETPIELAGWRTLPGGSHHDHDSTWEIEEIGEYSEGYGEERGDAFVKEMVEECGYYHVPSIGWVFVASRGAHILGGCVDAIVIPDRFVLCAAADHCLGAAYRGECPGVDPDELMRWRAESRARFQGRSVDEVLADVERAKEALMRAPLVSLGGGSAVRDMRQPVELLPIRELPEAATRLGIGYISGPLVGPDGRQKITCSGTADQIRAFLDHWAPAQGLVDAYGDPQRGFAGAYLTTEGAS